MKNINKFILLLVAIITINSCTKEEIIIPNPTLDTYLTSNADLSMFSSLLDKAQLADFKNGLGPFTWFAPNNAAFAASGITQANINALTTGNASYLALYHLFNGRLASQDMIAKNSVPRASQLGTGVAGQFFVGLKAGENYVNGSKITTRDVELSNGVLHVINRVNTPPLFTGNAQAIIMRTGQHTIFQAAMTRCGLWAQLAGTSIFTVMAPTDAAMTADGITLATVPTINISTLTNTMRYHYFNNVRLFSNDFVNGTTPQTALAGRALIVTNNGATVKGTANTTNVTISVFNILGTNGVVHILDGVLKP